MASEDAANVRVSVRFRPQNSLETQSGGVDITQISEDGTSVTIVDEGGAKQGQWQFDRIFRPNSSQDEVYTYAAQPLVADTLEGFSCTIFTYGQTGSGKTHTMMGVPHRQPDGQDLRGVIPRMIDDIFTSMYEAPESAEFTVRAAYMELYLEKINDLINPLKANLRVREDPARGVYVEGITETYTCAAEEMLELMHRGSDNKKMASTRMNADSSRSHSIFQITTEQKDNTSGLKKIGNMFLVDLAGSEMVGKTQATGQTLEEAKMINKSLSALGNVIKALVSNSGHIPYRDSKLTRVLQDSLGGNSKTSLVIACSSSSYNAIETMSTLRFGARAKCIKNKPRANMEMSSEEYKRLLNSASEREKELRTYVAALEREVQYYRDQYGHSAGDGIGAIVSLRYTEDHAKVNERKDVEAAGNSPPPAGIPAFLDAVVDLIGQADPLDENPTDAKDVSVANVVSSLKDLLARKDAALTEVRDTRDEVESELTLLRERYREKCTETEGLQVQFSSAKQQIKLLEQQNFHGALVSRHTELSAVTLAEGVPSKEVLMRASESQHDDAALDEAFEQDSAGGLSEASSDEEEGAGKKVRKGSEGDDDSGGEFSDSESDNLSEIDEDEEELQRIQEELEKDDSNEREENLADMLRDVMNTKTRLKNKYNELRFEKKTYEELFQQHGGEYGMSSEKFAQTVKEATIMRKLLHKTQLEKQTLEHQAGMQNALEFIVAELQENVRTMTEKETHMRLKAQMQAEHIEMLYQTITELNTRQVEIISEHHSRETTLEQELLKFKSIFANVNGMLNTGTSALNGQMPPPPPMQQGSGLSQSSPSERGTPMGMQRQRSRIISPKPIRGGRSASPPRNRNQTEEDDSPRSPSTVMGPNTPTSRWNSQAEDETFEVARQAAIQANSASTQVQATSKVNRIKSLSEAVGRRLSSSRASKRASFGKS